MRGRSAREYDAAWRQPKVLAIFALIFLCGIATGGAITRSFLHPRIEISGVRPKAADVTLHSLKESLGLTPDQERVVMQVLDDYAKYYENLEDDRRSVAEHGKRQILQVLNPDQQKRFLAMFSSPWPPPQSSASN